MNVSESAAQEAGAILVGQEGVTVKNEEFFDSFSLETHGIGTGDVRIRGHLYAPDIVPCSDRWCARCTKSTTGQTLSDAHLAPSTMCGRCERTYPSAKACCEGHPPTRIIRTWDGDGNEGERLEAKSARDSSYDENVAAGGNRAVTAIGDGITSKDAYLGAPLTWLMKAPVEPSVSGGSKSRKRSSGRSTDPLAAEYNTHRKMTDAVLDERYDRSVTAYIEGRESELEAA